MAKSNFRKNGFNAYMAKSAPSADRCEGFYANVEELRTVFGTKLEVVLIDCNDNEIYRSKEGKSKYKEYDKSYQDALRKSFASLEAIHVKQKDVLVLAVSNDNSINSVETKEYVKIIEITKPKVSRNSGNLLPDAKFSNYSNSGKTFLLQKTTEGYSLYEESTSAADGLLLKGKIIVMDKVVKSMDSSGNVADASFDPSGNLVIKQDGSSMVYKSEN